MDLAWTLAFSVGIGTSLVELLSRYRDEPFKVIATSQFAWVYLLLNGALAIGAYIALIQSPYGEGVDTLTGRAALALAAGLGAAVILRSRVFTAQLGDEQVSIGPGYVVDQLLQIIDAQIDRRRALQRVQIVVEVMKGKDFEGAKTHASTMITGSRQNLTLQAQQDLANQIREVSDRKIPDQERSYALGFILLDFMGEGFLRQVAHELPIVPSEALADASGTVDFDALTASDKIVPRDWGASLPVKRADLVQELLANVPLVEVNTRVDQLIAKGEIGRDEAERRAILHEIDRVLDRDDNSEVDKVFAVGFVVHEHVDGQTFRKLFGNLERKSGRPKSGRPKSSQPESSQPKPDYAALREDSSVDRPITGTHSSIAAPAGPLPAAGSGPRTATGAGGQSSSG